MDDFEVEMDSRASAGGADETDLLALLNELSLLDIGLRHMAIERVDAFSVVDDDESSEDGMATIASAGRREMGDDLPGFGGEDAFLLAEGEVVNSSVDEEVFSSGDVFPVADF